jgi:hypothetical protein
MCACDKAPLVLFFTVLFLLASRRRRWRSLFDYLPVGLFFRHHGRCVVLSLQPLVCLSACSCSGLPVIGVRSPGSRNLRYPTLRS